MQLLSLVSKPAEAFKGKQQSQPHVQTSDLHLDFTLLEPHVSYLRCATCSLQRATICIIGKYRLTYQEVELLFS